LTASSGLDDLGTGALDLYALNLCLVDYRSAANGPTEGRVRADLRPHHFGSVHGVD
jgi:hypothetical protein